MVTKSYHKFLYISILLLATLALLATWAIEPIDYTPYQTQPYYQNTLRRIKAIRPVASSPFDTVQAGWARVNFTPQHPTPLAGYGNRWGRPYEQVHDSVFVKAFVFKNKQTKAAIVTADMLIIPPELVKRLATKLQAQGWRPDQVYLSATHTHHSIGGWAKNLVGTIIAGSYDDQLVDQLSVAFMQAINLAAAKAEPALFGFTRCDADSLVSNRLVGEAGAKDKWTRVVKIRQLRSGHTALLTTFAAHANFLASRDRSLSADYPGRLAALLEKDGHVNFSAYCAGAVGSHAPCAPGETPYLQMENFAQQLAYLVRTQTDTLQLRPIAQLRALQIPLGLRQSHWRITQNYRLHPWFFENLYGQYPAYLSALQLGDMLWLGTPCDFSGELMQQLEIQAKQKGFKLLVTSFNGGYIGYVTKDEHYHLDHFETRAMNWFGPYNGAYFSELMATLIQHL